MKSKREQRLNQELADLEAEFGARLLSALTECAAGTWGLFRQNDHIDAGHSFARSGGAYLAELGAAIEGLRHKLGLTAPFGPYARLCRLSGRQGENFPGERRLAKAWLAELEHAPSIIR